MKLMKHFLIALLILSILPLNALAAPSTQSDSNIIYFDDGSYITISVTSVDSRSSFTRIGSKTYVYNNALGTKKWEATITGTFTYDGTVSTCTTSSISVNILDTSWYIVSQSASKSGNTATGVLVMGYKFLGVTTDKRTVNLSLTCDANGYLS